MRTRLLVLLLALAPGCAMNDKDLCPESQGMRCATAPDCVRDAARGCRVCQCGNPYSTAPVTPMRAPNDPGRVPDPTLPPR
ncbi:MAG TPA: hypothetical protein VMT11_20745 [Myxococcaceae bacterium]|nr:hypothetical protein [Myxococcaceae bacterium]